MLEESLVRSEGLEPSTFGAEIRRSIQLNYERIVRCCLNYWSIMLLVFCIKQKTISPYMPADLRSAST